MQPRGLHLSSSVVKTTMRENVVAFGLTSMAYPRFCVPPLAISSGQSAVPVYLRFSPRPFVSFPVPFWPVLSVLALSVAFCAVGPVYPAVVLERNQKSLPTSSNASQKNV